MELDKKTVVGAVAAVAVGAIGGACRSFPCHPCSPPCCAGLLRICSQVSGHVFRHFEPMETAGEDGDEGYLNESDEACVRPVEDRVQPAIAAEPSEGPLDDPSDFAWNEFSFGATHLDLDSKILPNGLQVFSLI